MYLIFYDIKTDRLRNRISKLLLQNGYERLQFSVFIGVFNPEKNKVWNKIEQLLLHNKEEKVYCIKISVENFKNIKILGDFLHDINYICAQKSSLII